jgi:MATE family multidrug resistance protein
MAMIALDQPREQHAAKKTNFVFISGKHTIFAILDHCKCAAEFKLKKLISFYRLYRNHVKETLRLSVPIIFAQLGFVLMGVADTVMIGELGSTNVAAAGISVSIYFLVVIIGLGTMTAISPMVSKAAGAGDYNLCGMTTKAGVTVALLMSLVLMAVLFLMIAFFGIFQQPPAVTAMAKEFLFLLTLSTPPLLIFSALKSFTDALTHTRFAMYISISGLLVNVFFNWLLIGGNFGFPAWGLNGAGLATLIARLYMMVAIILVIRKNPVFKLYFERPTFFFSPLVIRNILKLGLPAGMQYFFEVSAFSGASVLCGRLGTQSSAAHQITISLASVTFMVAVGVSSAGSIRVGTFAGLNSRIGIIKAGTSALMMAGAFMFVACLVFLGLNGQLIRLYIEEPQVIEIATGLLVIAAIFQISDGVQTVGLGILRGISDVKMPTVITLFAYWIIGIPLGYYLAFHRDMGAEGIWIGLLAGLTTSACLLTLRFFKLALKPAAVVSDR